MFHQLQLGAKTFVRDVADGFFEITHNGFALLGLALVFAIAMLQARPDLRSAGEEQLLGWLRSRQELTSSLPGQMEASARATASNPKDLSKPQAAVARWLSHKYKVAQEPVSAIVIEAWESGRRNNLDPNLILAVMAIESAFNPFAQSEVGAQGLMQVMTRVHRDKYDRFGGRFAAFDPVANLRVGTKVLKDCIDKAGSVEGGLRFYVGASNTEGADDNGYPARVMAELTRLNLVASGQTVPISSTASNNSLAATAQELRLASE
jgi:soluble lytic murein transglycosylase-like protein